MIKNKNNCLKGAKKRAKFAPLGQLFRVFKYGKLFVEFLKYMEIKNSFFFPKGL